MQETGKTGTGPCEGSFVDETPADCVVWPTKVAQVASSAAVRSELKLKTQPILGHYGELHHADVSLLLKKGWFTVRPCTAN